MLDIAVGIEEFGATAPTSGRKGVLQHAFQPIPVPHLHVVVQEQQHFAAGLSRGKVVQLRVVEAIVPGDQPRGWAGPARCA